MFILIILINLVIILYIYLNYYKSIKNTNINTSKIEEIDPMIKGCIKDNGFNNTFDIILAGIINLNIKRYIIIEYDKKDISKYNYTIKANFSMESPKIEEYELILLNFIFSNKTEINRQELEEKLINSFKTYNVQYNELQKVIKEKLIKENIIDKDKKENIEKFSKKYKRISIIIFVIMIIIKLFNANNSIIYLYIYILEYIIAQIMLRKSSNYTEKGDLLREQIINYKKKLEHKEFLIDKVTMDEIILDKEFADSLALNINTNAKKAFIDEIIMKDAMDKSKKITIKVVVILCICILLGILLMKVTQVLGKDGIIILYILLVIIIACVADITMMLSTSKKQKF